MFGNTYPIIGLETTLGERLRDPGLADYVRWEFPPADRARVIMSVRGGFVFDGPARPRRPGLGRRLRRWVAARRASPARVPAESLGVAALEAGLLFRAFPYKKL